MVKKKFFGQAVMQSEGGNELSQEERGLMKDRYKKVIAVKAVSGGAGATFVAMNLALKLGAMTGEVSFAEGRAHGKGRERPFDLLSIDKKFGRQKWHDFYSRPDEQSSPGKPQYARANIFAEVNWAVRMEPDAERTMSMDSSISSGYRSLAGRYIVVDNPEDTEDADVIIAVVDPMPSQILCGFENICRLKETKNCPVIWVMNKNNSRVFVREVEHFIGQKMDFRVELVPAEELYRAQYSGTFYGLGCIPAGIEQIAAYLLA